MLRPGREADLKIAAAVRRLNGAAPPSDPAFPYSSSLQAAQNLVEICAKHGWKIKAWGDMVEGFVASSLGSDGTQLPNAHGKTKAVAICEAFLQIVRQS